GLEVLGVITVSEQARAQAGILLLACERLGDAVERLSSLPDLHAELDDVRALEDEGDAIHRDGLARIFAGGDEPIEVLRAKELHDRLEAAVDAVATAARLVERILLKNR